MRESYLPTGQEELGMAKQQSRKCYLVFQFYDPKSQSPPFTYRSFGPFESLETAEGFANGYVHGAQCTLVGLFSTWQRARKCVKRLCDMEDVGDEWESCLIGESRGLRQGSYWYEPIRQRLEYHLFVWNTQHGETLLLKPEEVTDCIEAVDDSGM